ncbi:peptidoglycan D,D-transpeptidase FtsI family protein [Luteimicrobium sp. DT211]|uniref:peptidoglycan D,D-transpeptidase FtsI family protein n=1 Tax=Luteimicrobium sp. DT211 TaxID=3393412 RepID=UPI003CF46B2E
MPPRNGARTKGNASPPRNTAAPRRPAPAARRPAPRPSVFRKAGRPEVRLRWVAAVVALALLAFLLRLAYVQLYDGAALAARGHNDRLVTTVLPAARGDITDANGVVLATSQARYTLIANPTSIARFVPTDAQVAAYRGAGELGTGAVAAAKLLAPLVHEDASTLGAALNASSKGKLLQYKVLAKDLLPEAWRAIDALGIAGISSEQTSERVYPAGATAGNLLGYVDADQQGAGGLEKVLDGQLSGTPGQETFERGVDGQRIPTGTDQDKAAQPGSDVALTIDQDIQWYAQDAADKAKKDTGATWVIVVVQDVKTGALYALANSGTADPNDSSVPVSKRGSVAVEGTFEPGSTGKIITMAGLLESGLAKPSSQFQVGYTYQTSNGQTFHDSHEHGVEKLTLAGILAESSNSGTVQAGSKMTAQSQYDTMRAFGLGQHTGLGLPGESAGILRQPQDWDGRTRYSVLFGQGLSANAVQVAGVYSTIANGGVRQPAHVVASTTAPDGTKTPADLADGSRVVSEKTAKQLTRMLEGVVGGDDGTGAKAAVPGYQVAGKTGTAEAVGSNGQLSSIVSSFAGFAPADNPRLTVGVFVKDPKTSIYGGETAAPVFSKVMGFALHDLGVAPSAGAAKPYKTTW